MMLRFPLFIDPRYNAEQDVEFDAREVESVEQSTRSRLFAGTFPVTVVRLSGGREYLLGGHFGAQIEAARQETRE